jgi:hypothetical protein
MQHRQRDEDDNHRRHDAEQQKVGKIVPGRGTGRRAETLAHSFDAAFLLAEASPMSDQV